MKQKIRVLLSIICMVSFLFSSSLIAQAAPKKKVSKRFFGKDRFETSMSIASGLSQEQQVNNVVLASAYSFPDALAASTLAYKLQAPILLVGNGMPDSLTSCLYVKEHLAPGGTVTIVGGAGVIPHPVEQWMINNGFKVVRYGGSDRFGTDALIVQQLNVPKGTPVIIANAYDFPDALGISSLAASKGWPILLSGGNSLPKSVQDFLSSDQPTNVYIIGGNGVINNGVQTQIQTLCPNTQIQRFGGSDRFETLSLILTKFYPNPAQIYVANGLDFADALSGSTLAAANNAPILLVDPKSKSLPASIYDYLITLRNNGVQPQVNVLGGDGAVPQKILDIIDEILQVDSDTVPPTSTSETLAVSSPSISGFSVTVNPALNGLAASSFTLKDSAGNTIAVTSAATSDNGATYSVGAALIAGQTYTISATAAGYTFNAAQSFTVPAVLTNETLTVSNPSVSGFNVTINPALNGLTASSFTLKDGAGNTIAVTSAATSDNGVTYSVGAALIAGQTYTVSAAATGYSFGSAQSFTVPSAIINETMTVSSPLISGFNVTVSPALNSLTANNFMLKDSAGNTIAVTSATTSDNGATYSVGAALIAGQTYTVSAAATGYTFNAAQSFTVPVVLTTEALAVINPSISGFSVTVNPALNGLAASSFTLKDSAGNPITVTSATTSDNGATYSVGAALIAGQTYTVSVTAAGYSFGDTLSFAVPN